MSVTHKLVENQGLRLVGFRQGMVFIFVGKKEKNARILRKWKYFEKYETVL